MYPLDNAATCLVPRAVTAGGLNLHSRGDSLSTLSRASFSSQLAQLTAIRLPKAESLTRSIAAISSSTAALIVLEDTTYQIHTWSRRISTILNGLEADDDIQWAAAAGRDGVGKLDGAINTFEDLMEVYVNAIEDLHQRKDASIVSERDMNRYLDGIEEITAIWQGTKGTLEAIKQQVELSLDWEELQNKVFHDIGAEIEALCRVVFEMEERRHGEANKTCECSQTDVIETVGTSDSAPSLTPNKRLSLIPPVQGPSVQPTNLSPEQEDAMLGLYARMQPLRASLDFLPMRIATFQSRAEQTFPSACRDLEEQRLALEQEWTVLERDAECLRKELGEDRWVLVFRNAAKQALRMIDSVARSIAKVDESLDSNTSSPHAPTTLEKIESYKAKKMHYSAAIERVIAIVATGLSERRTLNGEIIRLKIDVCQRYSQVIANMRNLDSILATYTAVATPCTPLRQSLVSDSPVEASDERTHLFTPQTSPASSLRGLDSRNTFPRIENIVVPYEQAKMFIPPKRPLQSNPRHRPTTSSRTLAGGSRFLNMPVRASSPSNTIQTLSRPDPSQPFIKSSAKPRWNSSTIVEIKPRRSNLGLALDSRKEVASPEVGYISPPLSNSRSSYGTRRWPRPENSSPAPTLRPICTKPPSRLAFAVQYQLPTPEASPVSQHTSRHTDGRRDETPLFPIPRSSFKTQLSRSTMRPYQNGSNDPLGSSPKSRAPLQTLTSSPLNIFIRPTDTKT